MPISTIPSGALPNRHTIVSGSGVDPYGFFPVVAPVAGSYSLKLGNSMVGAQAERARYKVHVPATPNNYILIYRYAVVLEDPGHDPPDQARFTVRATDSATNQVLPCSDVSYVASATLPGFAMSSVPSSSPSPDTVYYKEWSSATLNLTGYNGHTIYLDFATGDCALKGHFGYAYVDMNCGFFEIEARVCAGSTGANLNGPVGFQSYQWFDASFTTVIGTTQAVTVPVPAIPTAYALVVTPYAGFGCADTFYTTVKHVVPGSSISATACPDTAICSGKEATLYINVTGTNAPFTYEWSPSTDLNCPTCSMPRSAIVVDRKYYVSVTDVYGCESSDSVNVSVLPAPTVDAGNNRTVCEGQTTQLQGNFTGASSCLWYPAAGLSNPNIINPIVTPSTIQTYFITAKLGVCTDTDEVNVIIPVRPVVNAGPDTALCRGELYMMQGSITGTSTSRQWFPNNGLNAPFSANPVFTAINTITYYFRAANGNCADTDTVNITIKVTPLMVLAIAIVPYARMLSYN